MTIGIYCLQFKGTDRVYIGQSVNVEARYTQHLNSFNTKKASKKLTSAYILYGVPSMLLLTECMQEELDVLENEAIDLYNSISNGFNSVYKISKVTQSRFAEDNPNSKYTRKQIEEVFFLLLEELTSTEILNITGIPVTTIQSISSCNAHTWLKYEYPVEYIALESRKKLIPQDRALSALARKIVYPEVVSPEGVHYKVSNVNKFCREHSLHPGNLHSVLTGKRSIHKGWHI